MGCWMPLSRHPFPCPRSFVRLLHVFTFSQWQSSRCLANGPLSIGIYSMLYGPISSSGSASSGAHPRLSRSLTPLLRSGERSRHAAETNSSNFADISLDGNWTCCRTTEDADEQYPTFLDGHKIVVDVRNSD